MIANRTTRRLIEAYTPEETWERDHQQVSSCFELEDTLAWGVSIFRHLKELDARHQEKGGLRGHPSAEECVESMTHLYEMWVVASSIYFRKAKEFVALGYEVENLDEFEVILEEARCMVGGFDLEDAIPPIEVLSARAHPDNPNPARYRD